MSRVIISQINTKLYLVPMIIVCKTQKDRSCRTYQTETNLSKDRHWLRHNIIQLHIFCCPLKWKSCNIKKSFYTSQCDFFQCLTWWSWNLGNQKINHVSFIIHDHTLQTWHTHISGLNKWLNMLLASQVSLVLKMLIPYTFVSKT